MSQRNFMPLIALMAATILCLAPFANKAFHVDDEPFLWIARQINAHPFDPYGFEANWYGRQVTMHALAKNPPLNAYYIALVTSLFGWREITLHIAFLLPAIAAILGTYFLASDLCSRPLAASLATLLTPAFFVSSTTVMCDTMMLAFWIWTITLWIRGLKRNDSRFLLGSALLLTISVLVKYTAINLIPLLAVYSLAETRTIPGAPVQSVRSATAEARHQAGWVLYLSLPLLIFAIYEGATRATYGHGFLFDAFSFSTHALQTDDSNTVWKILIGFSFTGGCFMPILFYAPLLWRRRTIILAILGAAFAVVFLSALSLLGVSDFFLRGNMDGVGEIKWGLLVQFVIFSVGGIHILALATADFLRRKDSSSVLLFLWVLGIFVFGTYLNWAINVRSFLPMAPAAVILVMRRLELHQMIPDEPNTGLPVRLTEKISPAHNHNIDKAYWPLGPAVLIAVLVASADYAMADGARNAAISIHKQYSGQQILFQGHWGFQYYMESFGAQAFDPNRSQLDTGALMIIPSNNPNPVGMPKGSMHLIEIFSAHPFPWLATMDRSLGAGFYYHGWRGPRALCPLPYALGPTTPDEYFVFRWQPSQHDPDPDAPNRQSCVRRVRGHPAS